MLALWTEHLYYIRCSIFLDLHKFNIAAPLPYVGADVPKLVIRLTRCLSAMKRV
jgi:hypothetical protein